MVADFKSKFRSDEQASVTPFIELLTMFLMNLDHSEESQAFVLKFLYNFICYRHKFERISGCEEISSLFNSKIHQQFLFLQLERFLGIDTSQSSFKLGCNFGEAMAFNISGGIKSLGETYDQYYAIAERYFDLVNKDTGQQYKPRPRHLYKWTMVGLAFTFVGNSNDADFIELIDIMNSLVIFNILGDDIADKLQKKDVLDVFLLISSQEKREEERFNPLELGLAGDALAHDFSEIIGLAKKKGVISNTASDDHPLVEYLRFSHALFHNTWRRYRVLIDKKCKGSTLFKEFIEQDLIIDYNYLSNCLKSSLEVNLNPSVAMMQYGSEYAYHNMNMIPFYRMAFFYEKATNSDLSFRQEEMDLKYNQWHYKQMAGRIGNLLVTGIPDGEDLSREWLDGDFSISELFKWLTPEIAPFKCRQLDQLFGRIKVIKEETTNVNKNGALRAEMDNLLELTKGVNLHQIAAKKFLENIKMIGPDHFIDDIFFLWHCCFRGKI